MTTEPKKILVVDDDPLTLERVQSLLEGEGYVALCARDGDEALEMARREKPDLVIIDLLLPQKNGFELALELKREPDLAKTPLIFITAYFASNEIKAKFRRLPNGGSLLHKLVVLHKPLEKKEFIDSLHGVLQDGAWNGPKRILVVDDDAVNLELIGRRLEVDRMTSVAAQTGAEALQLLQRDPFDAVLLDLRLPDQDGFKILAEIRKTHACMPVVIMTAHGSETVAAKAVGAGASDYLIKPIGRRELTISLRNALYKSQLQLETQRVQKNLFDAMLALQQSVQEINREQRRLGGVLESLNEGVVVLDAATDRVERFNPAVLDLLRHASAPHELETLFAGVSEFRDEAEQVLDKNAFLQALKTGVHEAEYLLRWADGQEKSFLLTSKPFMQIGQAGYVLVLRDVTRRRTQRQHLEAMLRSQSDTLSNANQRLRHDLSAVWQEADDAGMHLLSSVAGELKKSLNIVVSLACHLISGVEGSLAPRQHELVEQMLSGAEDLSERMGDLLDYALLRSAGQGVRKRIVHLDEVLRAAVEENQPRARARDVKLLFAGECHHAEAWGHPDFLLKIVRQLLSNAIESSAAGGCVTVGLIAGQDSENGIEIRDQGQGISPELSAQLLGKDRENGLRGFSQGGTAGLGLYLVKGYADLTSARLEVKSVDGRGSVFRVFLPKAT